jgi:hypothetical protein
MTTEIERLKRDLRVMYAAFDAISTEPRIGVTMFAPGNTVRTIPLSGNIAQLMEAVGRITTMGPVGDEEWAGSVERTIVRRPLSAHRRAVAAATLVFPTPPLPV